MKIPVVVTDTHVHKGICGSSEKCAVALALIEQGFGLSHTTHVEVDCDNVHVWDDQWKPNKHSYDFNAYIHFPKAVSKFINEFDSVRGDDEERKKLETRLKKKPLKFELDVPDAILPMIYKKGKKKGKK